MQRGSESRLCRDLRFLGCSASPLRHFIRRSTAEQLRSVGSGYRATAHASDRLALLSVTRSLRSKPPGIRSSPPGWLLACYNSSAFALATMLTSLCRRAQRWLLAGLGESGNSPLPPLRETRPAHKGVTVSVAYVAFLLALVADPVQRALIYLHPVRIPFGTDFSKPELVGFAPGKVFPFNLTTPDGAVLGAWQVLPSDVYRRVVEETYDGAESLPEGPLPQSVFDSALT